MDFEFWNFDLMYKRVTLLTIYNPLIETNITDHALTMRGTSGLQYIYISRH